MKKFLGIKVFASFFILISASFLFYQIWNHLGTLRYFSIPEKIIVKLYNHEENTYILDLMNNKLINGNKYIIVDTNKKYQGPIFPKNNQKYSYDRKFVSNDGNLSLSSGKVIFESNNEAEKFMWTADNKYYIKFNFSFGKESSPIDIYVYSLEENKGTYLGLIGTDGNSIKVKEIVGILK